MDITLEMQESTKRVEAEYGRRVVAIVLNEDDSVLDHCFNWHAGQCYAMDGHKVVAIADDPTMTLEGQQLLYDHERDCHRDCFGLND